MKEIISDFIKEEFYFDDEIKTKKQLLERLEDYDLSEYVD
jgi:hypothetical protein